MKHCLIIVSCIEDALKLHAAGEAVELFGPKVGNLEFDIITKTKLIECKNINWSKVLNESDLKANLMSHLTIAKQHKKIFEVHSKTKIPQKWKDWFNEKGIIYIED